ncbi:MAG: nitroreductase family protein [Ruminococcus sp.]|nr:nitroreductase family protein [Ruminococcus sp.]
MGNIKDYLQVIRHQHYINGVLKDDNYKASRLESEIMRNVHSVEKGLSLASPRKLFGLKKIETMLNDVEIYISLPEKSDEVIAMVSAALRAYFDFHSDEEYSELNKLKNRVTQILAKASLDCPDSCVEGGVLHTTLVADENDYKSLLKIAEQRHSVRDFSGQSVPMELLHKAMAIAQRAPSACNRQGVRAYIITEKNRDCLNGWLEGTGGFASAVDKYILITGKLSTYRSDEPFQYTVSASIFAGYLTLALQSVGIAACVIQRPLLHNNKWVEVSKTLGIPGDEQAVVMIGTGMPKEDYLVPVSHRMPYDFQVKEL